MWGSALQLRGRLVPNLVRSHTGDFGLRHRQVAFVWLSVVLLLISSASFRAVLRRMPIITTLRRTSAKHCGTGWAPYTLPVAVSLSNGHFGVHNRICESGLAAIGIIVNVVLVMTIIDGGHCL